MSQNLRAAAGDRCVSLNSNRRKLSRRKICLTKPPPPPFGGLLGESEDGGVMNLSSAGLTFTPVFSWERDGAATGSSNGGIKEEQSVP